LDNFCHIFILHKKEEPVINNQAHVLTDGGNKFENLSNHEFLLFMIALHPQQAGPQPIGNWLSLGEKPIWELKK